MIWAPLCAVLLHIFEEFVWPGGFTSWFREYKPEYGTSITPRFLFIVNAAFVLVCALVGVMGMTPRGMSGWITVVTIMVWNAFFHIAATSRMHRYSPGTVTACLLYLPLGVYFIAFMPLYPILSSSNVLIAIALGMLYPLWSKLTHLRRARTRPA